MFQSTPARERATAQNGLVVMIQTVSIHARPRAGDQTPARTAGSRPGFNPRPPASGRHHGATQPAPCNLRFNPRPPASGRLMPQSVTSVRSEFQSTPARERATGYKFSVVIKDRFQSTPARERATAAQEKEGGRSTVSIHARPRAGDISLDNHRPALLSFQSTPARERATGKGRTE